MQVQVSSINELKELCTDGHREYFVSLNGGCRSSKCIEFDSDANMFIIFNYIDESHQELTAKELMDDSLTIIGTAIRKGSLFLY